MTARNDNNLITVWQRLSPLKMTKYPYPKKGVQIEMKKAITLLTMILLSLSMVSCGNQAKLDKIPTDAERIVMMSLAEENDPVQPATLTPTPAPEIASEHYTYSTTAVEGRLSVSVDADVSYPASLKMPIARVSAMGFTQELASKYFEYFFAGEQPTVVVDHGAAKVTKQSLRDLIAQYEQEIADGTIMQQQLLTAEEAKEEIKSLEAQIPSAPETAAPDVISDGTFQTGVFMNNDDPEQLLELNVETKDKWMDLYTPADPMGHAEARLFYDIKNVNFGFKETKVTALAPNTSIVGMKTTWDEALSLCKGFLVVGGVNDMVVSEAFQLERDGRLAYRFWFVRTVMGVPLAVNHEGTEYKGVKTPWDYETLNIVVDDQGINDVAWGCPVTTTEIVNPAANAISFEQAKEIFEATVVQTYEPSTKRYDGFEWDSTVSVDNIVLSLLRVRDASTDERIGLYVPAWVFYGATTQNGSPHHNWSPQIVYAINAIDGTVINTDLGY